MQHLTPRGRRGHLRESSRARPLSNPSAAIVAGERNRSVNRAVPGQFGWAALNRRLPLVERTTKSPAFLALANVQLLTMPMPERVGLTLSTTIGSGTMMANAMLTQGRLLPRLRESARR